MSLVRIGMLIHRHSKSLGGDFVVRADQALAAHEAGSHTESVALASQCLERLLKEALQRWSLPVPGLPALGPLVGAVDKTRKSPTALIERLNLANKIRNSVLHDKMAGVAEEEESLTAANQGDSLLQIHILEMATEWFLKTFDAEAEAADEDDNKLRIFLSVGGPHRLDQTQFLGHLRTEMRRQGVQLLSLDGEYAENKPFDQIRELLATCHGALVLGMERSHAYAVFEKEKSDGEKYHPEQFVPTAWNQIEGSMASAVGLKVLVLRERRLHHEGIFEAKHHDHQICDFDLPIECRKLSSDLKQFLVGWVKKLRTKLTRQNREGSKG